MIAGWHTILLPAMSGWIALLETDAVLVGQWMVSRPIVAGPLVGLLCGKLAVGLAVGILCELFTLDVSPVGAVMPLNGTVAAGCGTLLAAGPDAVALAAAFPAGLALSVLFRRLETILRQKRGELGLAAVKNLQETGRIDWESVLLRGIGPQAAATALFVYVSVALLGPALAWGWSASPVFLKRGLEFGLRAAASVGAAATAYALTRKV